MVNKKEFSKRLNELLDYHEISASVFAKKIEVQRSSISHLLSGRNNPSLDFILKVLEHFPSLSFDWLVKGIGKLGDSSNSTSSLFDPELDSLTENSTTRAFDGISKAKKIKKILLFYTDGSFEEFNP